MSASIADFNQSELLPEKIQELLSNNELDLEWVSKKGLWDGRTFMRRNASNALRFSGGPPPELASLLLVAAKDSDPEVRVNVVHTLGTADMPPELAMQGLMRAINDREEIVRSAAQESLERLAQRVGAALIPLLVDTLASPDGLARMLASQLLVRYQEEATQPLLAALLNENPVQMKEALSTLVRLGMAASEGLVRALEEPRLRAHARRLLVLLPGLTEPAYQELQKLALSQDAALAAIASDIMAQVKATEKRRAAGPLIVPLAGFNDHILGPEELEASQSEEIPIAALLAELGSGTHFNRANAAALLGQQAAKADPEIKILIGLAVAALIRDGKQEVRRAVVKASAQLQTQDSIEALVKGISDPDPEIAQEASTALTTLEPGKLPWLLATVKAQQPLAAHQAIVEALVSAGPAAVTTLADTLSTSTNPTTRALAARAISLIGPPAAAATPALIEALGDAVDEVREAAATALGFVAQQEAGLMEALKKSTKDGALPVRVAASIALERIKGTYQPPQAAMEPEPIPIEGFEQRWFTMEEIAEPAAKLPAIQLIRALSDGRPLVRHNAALALGANTEDRKSVARALSVCVLDSDSRVRWAATTALGVLGAEAVEPAGPALIRALADPQLEVSQAAQTVIATLGDAAIPTLVEALDGDLDRVSRNVLPVLVVMGEKAVEPLVRSLSHLSVRVRAAAARGLGMLGPQAAGPAREAVLGATKETSDLVKAEAKRALDAIDGIVPPPRVLEPVEPPLPGFDSEPLSPEELKKQVKKLDVQQLVRALSDGRPTMRQNAATALGVIGKGAADAAGSLALAVRDDNPDVRASAAQALGQLGAEAAAVAVPALLRALTDPVAEVATAAKASLEGLGSEALDPLVQALDCEPDLAARTVLPLLAELGKAAIGPLLPALDHLSVRVRANAATALGLIGPDAASQAREPLTKLLADPDALVKAQARRAIDAVDGVVPPPKVMEPEPLPLPEFDTVQMEAAELKKQAKKLDVGRLVRALSDGRHLVRLNAATALGVLGTAAADAAPALALATRDEKAEVQQEAATALGALGADGVPVAIPALLKAMTDPKPEVVEAANNAIGALGAVAIDALVEGLNRQPEEAAKTVIPALVAQGAAVVDPLSQALNHLSVWVRTNAVKALGLLGPKDGKSARAAVEAATRDANEQVRSRAGEALDRIDGVEPLPLVLEPEPLPLADFGSQSLDADFLKKQAKSLQVDRLKRGLFDGRTYVRENSARALGTLGKAAESALIEMLVALKDSEWSVREATAIALGELKFDPDKAVPALAMALAGKDKRLEGAIIQAIDNYGKAAIDPLMNLLHARPEAVLPSVGPVCYHLPDTFLKPLTDRLGPEYSIVVRENAADVIGSMAYKARPASKKLLEALEEMDILFRVKVMRAAVNVMGKNGDLINALKAIQDSDSRPSVQIVLEDLFLRLGVK
ncbi:MAG: HEAT repeat domain-containing protein [Bradymonadales bacterium]|nr:HEAT repeat domain-containing protein [Bradymonadales bacterium]